MTAITALAGIDGTPTGNPSVRSAEPFNNQREQSHESAQMQAIAGNDDMKLDEPDSPTGDRRTSKEWDASKVPPSRFQKRSGSIYSTPSSRDSHLSGSDRDKAYHEKLKEGESSGGILGKLFGGAKKM